MRTNLLVLVSLPCRDPAGRIRTIVVGVGSTEPAYAGDSFAALFMGHKITIRSAIPIAGAPAIWVVSGTASTRPSYHDGDHRKHQTHGLLPFQECPQGARSKLRHKRAGFPVPIAAGARESSSQRKSLALRFAQKNRAAASFRPLALT